MRWRPSFEYGILVAVSDPHVLNYRLNVCAFPAVDVPGQWVASCLELDVVTQGNDATHAVEMLQDAIFHVITESQPNGMPEFKRPDAELLLAFSHAPVWGTFDVSLHVRWQPDQSRPTFE